MQALAPQQTEVLMTYYWGGQYHHKSKKHFLVQTGQMEVYVSYT